MTACLDTESKNCKVSTLVEPSSIKITCFGLTVWALMDCQHSFKCSDFVLKTGINTVKSITAIIRNLF